MQNVKRRYDRFFIMLKKEMNGYAIDTREPSGYCKVEVQEGKGKISTYIQGLKPGKDGSLYRVYIIAAQEGNALGIPINNLDVDHKGHAECKWEFNPDNVDGTGLPIEKFNVASIIVKGDNVKDIIAPFVGYKDKEILWKNGFKAISNEVKKEDLKQLVKIEDEKPEVQRATDKKPINETTVDKKIEDETITDKKSPNEKRVEPVGDDAEQESNPHKIFNDMVNKFYAEMEELEKYKVLNAEDVKVLDLDIKVAENDNTDELTYMFKSNEKIVPFEKSNKEINWIKIAPFELVTLDLPAWTYIKHQFINACWKKQKHLILGRYFQNKEYKYILGVPDQYNENCVNIANDLGFKNFVGYRGKTTQKDDKGYWIMEL